MKFIQVGAPMFRHIGKYYQVDTYIANSFLDIDKKMSLESLKGNYMCFWYEVQTTNDVLVYKCKFMKSGIETHKEVVKEVEEIL